MKLYTILEAIECYRQNKEKDTFNIKSGRCELDKPIILTKEDNGIKLIATDEVILSGAKKLNSLKWEQYSGDIYMATIDKNLNIDGIYVNDEYQVMARYPNYDNNVLPLGGVCSEADIKQRVKKYASVEGGCVRTIHEYCWGGNSYTINGKDENSPTGLKLDWVGDNNRGSKYHTEKLLIENIFEELDAEKEWFYNKNTGVLYYCKDEKTDLDTATIEIVVNSDIIIIDGAKDIVLDGFTIEKTARTMFNKKYIPLLRGDWAVCVAATILINDAEDITIKNCNFFDVYGNAIFIYGDNKNHIIENNEFINIGSTCIQIVGKHTACYEPSFWEHEHYLDNNEYTIHKTFVEKKDKTGAKTEDYPRDIIIRNNHMQKMGIFEKQSCGINLSIASNIKIQYNTIHDSARSCINVNDGCFGGHEIAYNDIFNSQKETEDHGPFNSWGRDRFWSVPTFDTSGLNGKENKEYSLLDANKTTTIHHNRFHHAKDAPHSWGIDLDDGSSNYDIHNNLCLGIGVKLREGFKRRVHNNFVIGGEFNLHCTYYGAEDIITNNVVISKNPWNFAGQIGGEEKRLTEGLLAIDNNLYYNENEKVILPDFFERCGFDKNKIVDEKLFFIDANNNDYRVQNVEILKKLGIENLTDIKYGKRDCKFCSPIFSMDDMNEEELIEIEFLGGTISNITNGIISATATFGTDGVYIKYAPNDSKLFELGYQANMVIKNIDGFKINNISDFMGICK